MKNLKKLVLLIMFVVVAISATANSVDDIRSKSVLRVGTTGDYLPFTILENDKYSGYDIEVARYFAKELGVEVEFVPTTWKSLLKDLNDEKFDIAMGGISRRTSRKLEAEFTHPYLTYGKTPITRRKDIKKYNSFEKIDKKGVKVGYNLGGTNEKYALKNIKNATLIKFEKNLDVIQGVRDGKIDVMISETPEAVHYENSDKLLGSPMTNNPLTKNQLGYMVSKNDYALASLINYIMEDMELKGITKEMQKKYIK